MTTIRPLSGLPATTPLRSASAAAAPAAAPVDAFQAGVSGAPAPSLSAVAPSSRVDVPELQGTLYQAAPDGGMEEVRVFASTGTPVPVRDAQGRLSFVFPSQEGARTRVQRVDSTGEVLYSFLLPPTSRESQVAVDARGGRVYTLGEGRLQSFDLADGQPLGEREAGPGRTWIETRPGGGVCLRTPGALVLLDRDLRAEREISGNDPQGVVELPGGGVAVEWGNRGSVTVVDGAGRTTATLDGGLWRMQAGPDGALWGLQGAPWDREAQVVRVDPATGAVRRLPGVARHEGLFPQADGSYVLHDRPDLTNFTLRHFSPDGVEQRVFHDHGTLERLDSSPEGGTAWGLVADWQAEPPVNRLLRYDLEPARRSLAGQVLATFGVADGGREVHREVPARPGSRNQFIPTVLDGGRVAVSGQEGGSLLDRDGRVLKRYDSAEALSRDVDPEGRHDQETRSRIRILNPDLESTFARSQGAFRGVGGLHFPRPADAGGLPEAAGLDAEANEARLKGALFGREELPRSAVGFPGGAGRLWVEGDDGCLVVEVPDPANPGAFVRRSFWLDEFEHYTQVLPVSGSEGQYVVATDDRNRVHWFDPARSSDRQFPLEGARSVRQSGDHRILVTGDGGRILALEAPGQRLRTPEGNRLDVSPDDGPRIISSDTEVRVGSISLPRRVENG